MRVSRFKKFSSLFTTLIISFFVCFLLSFLASPASSILQNSQILPVFNKVWQEVNDNFYDSKFNGIDWKATREKYQPLIERTKSLDEASPIINQMLSELNTSHTRFYTQSEPAYYQLLGIFGNGSYLKEIKKVFPDGSLEYTGIGVFTKEIDGKTFISGILDGSPAARSELEVGDQILAVDGKNYQPIESFADKADKEVKLSVQRSADSNSIETITVIPKKINAKTVFLEAMRTSIETIERDNQTIGYVHVWSYAGDQYQELLTQELTYGKLKEADGLILDLRDGWGGATPDYLSIFTAKIPTLTQVNNGTRSGKEILAYGFKQYDIGPVVGTKTAGAVVGGSPFLMQDGSLLYLAVVDVFVNGERLEGKGVTPDIEVPYQLEYARGQDPQKDKALEVVVEAIKKRGQLKSEV
jgi:carboxyl-terminal processing protease